jgi:hypothetical protein
MSPQPPTNSSDYLKVVTELQNRLDDLAARNQAQILKIHESQQMIQDLYQHPFFLQLHNYDHH